MQYHPPQKQFAFPLALSWICVCPTAASALGLNSQDTNHGKKFLTPVALPGSGTSSIWFSLTKANPEQERKLATGRKVFAKCHSSGLGKEGRAADCSDPSAAQNPRVSRSFTQTGLQFLWSLSTAVHRDREPGRSRRLIYWASFQDQTCVRDQRGPGKFMESLFCPPTGVKRQGEGNLPTPTN